MKQKYQKLWIIILLIFAGQASWAQGKTELSFTASPTINWLSSDQKGVESGKVALGFNYGVNADFYFDEGNRYALATGLLINSTGGNLRYYDNSDEIQFSRHTFDSGTTFRYRLKYIEVPLALKLKTSQFRRWSYWGQFGFSGMINIQSKGDSSNDLLDKSNINDEVKLFNLALNIGVGSHFDLGGNNAINVGIVYKNGFMDVTSNNQFKDKADLNSLMLKLGLVF